MLSSECTKIRLSSCGLEKKGKQINSLGTWLSAWALYEQVMVYVYPQKYSELAYYKNLIMQQDKKFN